MSGQDADRADGADTRPDADTTAPREDTEPLPTVNPARVSWGAGGWGASYAGLPQIEPERAVRSDRFDAPVDRFGLPQHTGGRIGRCWEISNCPRPRMFAFPTGSGRGGAAASGRIAVLGLGALATLAAIGGLVFWLMNRSPSDTASEAAADETITTVTTAEAPRREPRAEAQLLRLLPAGYPPGACRAVDPGPGA